MRHAEVEYDDWQLIQKEDFTINAAYLDIKEIYLIPNGNR